MKKLAITALAVAGIVSTMSVTLAQTKPEDAIKLRQSAMKLIGYNFSSIGAMVNDKKPYNKEEAIRNANRVDALSGHPWEFFAICKAMLSLSCAVAHSTIRTARSRVR